MSHHEGEAALLRIREYEGDGYDKDAHVPNVHHVVKVPAVQGGDLTMITAPLVNHTIYRKGAQGPPYLHCCLQQEDEEDHE